MENYKVNESTIKDIITNSIIIINALFDKNPPDIFNSIGFETDKLSLADKDECRYILKKELVA